MTSSTVQPGLRAVGASPYTPIGYVNGTPIYPLAGGRGRGDISFAVGPDDRDPEFSTADDDDDIDEDDDEPDDEPDPRGTARRGQPQDPNAADWTPPTREAFERMETALKRANGTAAKHRRAGKTMDKLGIDDLPSWLAERGIDPDTGQTIGSDVVDPDALDDESGDDRPDPQDQRSNRRSDQELVRQTLAARKRAETAAQERYMPLLAQQSAENALLRAGFRGDTDEMNLILRLVDPAQVDVILDDDGFDITGIDEQVEVISAKFPQLFKQAPSRDDDERPNARRTPVRRRGASAVDGGNGGRQPAKQQGWAERALSQMHFRDR